MKVFISWSGKLSLQVALALRDWLPSVIQAIEPYISSEDIDKGSRWGNEIAKELESCDLGIICVTTENLVSPWLNFEAGALSKRFEASRVIPFLFGLRRADVPNSSPLTQFQSTVIDRRDVLRMMGAINHSATPPPVDDVRLGAFFDKWWPDLVTQLDGIDASTDHASKPKVASPTTDEFLAEILEVARSHQRELVEWRSEITEGWLASGDYPRFRGTSEVERLHWMKRALTAAILLHAELGRRFTFEEFAEAMATRPGIARSRLQKLVKDGNLVDVNAILGLMMLDSADIREITG